MGYKNGDSIINNGLVLSLDAADKNSYIGSGNNWKDLVGVNNGTLTNGPTFNSSNGGSIVLDGSNDYVALGTYNFGSTLTFSFWVYPTSINSTSNAFTSTSTGGFNVNGFRLFYNTFATQDSKIWIETGDGINGAAFSTDTPYLISKNIWQNIVFCLNKTSAQSFIYLNSTLAASGTTLSNFNTNTTFDLGRIKTSGYYLGARLGNVLAYNKVLTQSEITQNYNAQKSRFNL